MDESGFWNIIHSAWQSTPALSSFQTSVVSTLTEPTAKEAVEDDPTIPDETKFLDAIRSQLDELSADDLLQFDRILERKLYDIDREDVHEPSLGILCPTV